jgi:hypothetical protein
MQILYLEQVEEREGGRGEQDKRRRGERSNWIWGNWLQRGIQYFRKIENQKSNNKNQKNSNLNRYNSSFDHTIKKPMKIYYKKREGERRKHTSSFRFFELLDFC